jgi:foldase protein PrsA
MSERTHTAVGAGATARGKWTIVIAGTAVVLLAAGVAIQVTRPSSAYPEDISAGKGQSAGRAATGAEQPQKVKSLAKVGPQIIGYEEVASECVARHGKEILENLINRKIIQQACEAQGIEVSGAEVDKEIDRIAKKFNLDRTEYLKLLQTERNVTPAQYARDIIWPMLAMKKLAGEDIKITKDELQKAFIRNYGPRVEAKAIVLDNQRRASEVWKLANDNPDEFERLVRQHSVDENSRYLSGKIPPIPRYGGADELEKAAFKLKEGEISPVVQVGMNQFIILKCEGQTEPTVTKMDEQIEKLLREQLFEEKTQLAVAKVFQKLKDEATVINYLTGETKAGERRTAGGKPALGTGPVRPAGGAAPPRRSARPISTVEPEDEAEADELPPTPPPKSAGRGARQR